MRARLSAQFWQSVGLAAAIAVLGSGCRSEHGTSPPVRAEQSTESDADRAFWSWFVDHASVLAKEPSMIDVMEGIQKELEKGHRGVIAEIGTVGEDRLLVLSADGDRKLFPMIQSLFAARPTV